MGKLPLDQLVINEFSFPTPKGEDFRYFPLHLLREKEFQIASPPSNSLRASSAQEEVYAKHTIYIIDGVLSEKDQDLPFIKKNIGKISPSSFIEESDFFRELHQQHHSESINISINEDPIHIVFMSTQSQSISFPALIVNNHSQNACAYFSFISSKDSESSLNSLTIPYIQIHSDPDTSLTIHTLVNLTKSEMLLPYIEFAITNNTFVKYTFSYLSGILSRFAITSVLNGINAHIDLEGIYNTHLKDQLEIFVKMYHIKENTHSNQFFKGIADDYSHFSFNGDIIVKPNTPDVIANQLSKNIILGKGSKVMVRPQLHVKHHQIQCSHGTAIGNISEEELFYLNSRGIMKDDAMQLLLKGFLDEIIMTYPVIWKDIIYQKLNDLTR